ncbi:MAG: ATP-binding cassette domain-containing protein [Flavobacteriaceae bacterium]|nr:ATP-binding cassette domain-containing protein [Flavobacteriaceae bacterium]
MENPILVAENVTKKFGDYTALNNVSLKIPRNGIFGLLGPNGAGKTTLIRIINQITYPDQGKVWLNEELLHPKHIALIGYLPEERGLYKNMKVGDQALYLAQLKGLSKSVAKKRLQYWFEKFGVEDWWNKKVQELSKGMAQKIQFIVTVLHEPQLLIFDEPFSGFDPINANIIKDEILALRDKGTSIIFSTHRMESVEELCDEIALIHQSNKILDGKLKDIKQAYKTNTFEVGLQTANPEALTSVIEEQFLVSPANFNTLEDALKLEIQLGDKFNSKELLRFLQSKASVTHFVERIPSANDIFIQTVKNY